MTDGNGQYRIVDLRPGIYAVTFTLPGFNTVKREGLELSGTGVVQVNADLRVGSLQETVTVTGAAPVVDVQQVTRQQVHEPRRHRRVPTGRTYYALGVLIPSVSSNTTDVGGASGDAMAQLTVHGSRPSSQRITQNGVSTAGLSGSGGFSGNVPNVSAAAEVTIDTNAASAELATGGVRINFVPRDGGNKMTGSLFFNVAHEDFLASNNFTDRLRSAGLSAPDSMKKNWDFAPVRGGPILRDRLWYYATARYQGAQAYAAGMFHNRTRSTRRSGPTSGHVEAGALGQRRLAAGEAADDLAGQRRRTRSPVNGSSRLTAAVPMASARRWHPRRPAIAASRRSGCCWPNGRSPLTNRLLVESGGPPPQHRVG